MKTFVNVKGVEEFLDEGYKIDIVKTSDGAVLRLEKGGVITLILYKCYMDILKRKNIPVKTHVFDSNYYEIDYKDTKMGIPKFIFKVVKKKKARVKTLDEIIKMFPSDRFVVLNGGFYFTLRHITIEYIRYPLLGTNIGVEGIDFSFSDGYIKLNDGHFIPLDFCEITEE